MFEYIYINGRFYRPPRAKISVNDRGFMYGDGVFETMRSFGGNVFMLNKHMERLFHSLKVLKFSPVFDRRSLIDDLKRTLVKNRLENKDAYIKIMVTRGRYEGTLHFKNKSSCSLIIITKKLKPNPDAAYMKGVDIISSSIYRQAAGSQVYTHKLMNYFENLYEKDRAYSQGAFESVFITRDKLVLEGSTTNIFIAGKSAVYTPPLTQNILPGTTREAILDLCRKDRIRVWEKKIHYRDLINAREVFLTNSIAGIVPVRKVDVHKLAFPVPGRITSRLSDLYRIAVGEG